MERIGCAAPCEPDAGECDHFSHFSVSATTHVANSAGDLRRCMFWRAEGPGRERWIDHDD